MKLRLPRVWVPSIDTMERATRMLCQLCGAVARLALYLALALLIFKIATCDHQFVVVEPSLGSSPQI